MALWVGLFSGVVSIVLSLVAITVAILIERNSRAVTAQTIKSLQKIESDVERLSGDTRELIKAGWDRMLGSVSAPPPAEGTSSELAAGIAAELKAEFAPLIRATDQGERELLQRRLAEAVETLQSSLSSVSSEQLGAARLSAAVDRLLPRVESLSAEGLALLLGILSRRRHMEPDQYRQLRDGPLDSAVREVRRAGLLAPYRAAGRSDNDPPVYFLTDHARLLPAVSSLVPSPGHAAQELVKDELQRVGYTDDAE